MATSLPSRGGVQIKESIYAWEGKDKSGKTVRGELRAGGEAIVNVTLRRQCQKTATRTIARFLNVVVYLSSQ